MRTDSNLSTLRWDARGLNNGLIFRATYYGVTRLPPACSYAIGHVGTRLAYHLMRDGTDALVENLRVVRPEATERQLKALALLTYRMYAKDAIDFGLYRGLSTATDRHAGNAGNDVVVLVFDGDMQ